MHGRDAFSITKRTTDYIKEKSQTQPKINIHSSLLGHHAHNLPTLILQRLLLSVVWKEPRCGCYIIISTECIRPNVMIRVTSHIVHATTSTPMATLLRIIDRMVHKIYTVTAQITVMVRRYWDGLGAHCAQKQDLIVITVTNVTCVGLLRTPRTWTHHRHGCHLYGSI